MKKFSDAQDALAKETKGEFKEDITSDKIVSEIEELLKDKQSLDHVVKCDFQTAERVKYKLMNKGYRVQIYEEFKELHLGVWK